MVSLVALCAALSTLYKPLVYDQARQRSNKFRREIFFVIN